MQLLIEHCIDWRSIDKFYKAKTAGVARGRVFDDECFINLTKLGKVFIKIRVFVRSQKAANENSLLLGFLNGNFCFFFLEGLLAINLILSYWEPDVRKRFTYRPPIVCFRPVTWFWTSSDSNEMNAYPRDSPKFVWWKNSTVTWFFTCNYFTVDNFAILLEIFLKFI